MPTFSYKARRRSGEVVQGVLDVPDRSAALVQIERLGLFPVMVDAGKGAAAVATPQKSSGTQINFKSFLPPSLQKAMSRKRRPKLQELATFTQQMANLLNSGMPLTVALHSMGHLESKGIPTSVSRDLRQEVMEGRSLSDAMAKQPVIFSDLYINMVRAGEQSGSLVQVMRRMAAHFQQFAEVQSKFTSALIYPAMVVVVGAGLLTFFMTFVLPHFMQMFNGFNIPLPLPTRMLMAFTHVITNIWFVLGAVAGIAVIAIVVGKFCSSQFGRRKIDEWKINVPVVGKVVRLNLFGQFARTLSTLLQNGVPVLTALKITEQVMPNILVKEAVAQTREAVTDGKTLAQPLARSKIFPQLMVDLVKIGEETGDVPGALANVADTYESELQVGLRVMTNLIEPVLIVAMALVVGFLLLSVMLPMFKLIANINNQH